MTASPGPDLLRRAATHLRGRAAAATPGVWRTDGLYERVRGCICLSCYETEPWAWEIDVIDGPDSGDCMHPMHIGRADADYIEMMHPPVAGALADLLDLEAEAWDEYGSPRQGVVAVAQAALRNVDAIEGAPR